MFLLVLLQTTYTCTSSWTYTSLLTYTWSLTYIAQFSKIMTNLHVLFPVLYNHDCSNTREISAARTWVTREMRIFYTSLTCSQFSRIMTSFCSNTRSEKCARARAMSSGS